MSITDPFQQAYLTVLINRLEAPHWIGLYSTDVRRLWNHTVMMGYICVLNKSALYLHRMVSHTSGQMAVSFPSLTGKCLIITQRGPWEMEAACPWIVTDGGKTLNVTCSYQERYVTYLPRVSPFLSVFGFILSIVNSWKLTDIVVCPPTESIAFSYEVVCPETWVKFRGSCYYFETVLLKMTLEEARDHCKKKGTALWIKSTHSGVFDYLWV